MLKALAFLALLSTFLAQPACQTPAPGNPSTAGKVVKCGADAVQQCAPHAAPLVNECLAGAAAIVPCLLGLIQPAGCVTFEVVSCLVRKEGAAARAASARNPFDQVDQRRADRAEEFLKDRDVRFAD